ncbi:MAG: slipin family protein, partial [Synergistaceae bacterium]|nr:slipin family protein [Synergistaceae bacterium]
MVFYWGDLLPDLGMLIFLAFILVFLISWMIRVVPEYRRLVVFRLGHVIVSKGPGLVFVIPFIDRTVTVDLRILTL